ncbi:hypothetical protein GCM10011501_26780 [Thalassotalea profundi]|uniref:Uncharacterized protein n=1 Tax=Thalassotalea profundi TaxID=2036687 RepID=A0ABQ3IYM8_9GAMM|nr:hypothetical protein GCM10011501_26780 [Thalassotalea profundi]
MIKNAELSLNYKMAAILFIPTIALSIFIINPLVADLGFFGSLISGVLYGFIISFSMELRRMN